MIFEIEKNITELFSLIKEAGAIITNSVINEICYTKKGDNNFVTKLDYDIQHFLINALLKFLPSSNIISEEMDQINEIDPNEYMWIIDPIDGTTNIIHNYPHYCISVALIKKRNVLIGIIYNPISKELFHAIKGHGAFLNNSQIKVSEVPILKNALVGFGFPYDKNKTKAIVNLIGKIVPLVHDLRRTGSSALDLAYVACGRLDGFFEFDLEIWDHAAGRLLILESGGLISDWNNQISYSTNQMNIAATNKKIHNELMDQLKCNIIL